MLKGVSFKNYKAYDYGELEFRPITILLGANSSGKSSILQLLLMAEQTLNNENGYESALKLNGKLVSLGEIENIFKNKNLTKDISISFSIDSRAYPIMVADLRRLKRSLESEISNLYLEFRRIEQITSNINRKIENRRISNYSNEMSEDEVQFMFKEIKRIKRKISNSVIEEPNLFEENLTNKRLLRTVSMRGRDINKLLATELTEYKDSYEVLNRLFELRLNIFRIEYSFNYLAKDKSLEVSKCTIKDSDKVVLEFEKQKNKGHAKFMLNSEILPLKILDKYRVKFGKNIEFDTLNIIPKTNSKIDSIRFRKQQIEDELFCSNLLRIFSYFTHNLSRAFSSDRINYVSPLRAFPKRYYFLDESNVSSSLDTIDGDNLTEILKKEKKVIQKVNKWFNEFGLSVSVEDLKDVIHRLKINQNGLSLDITDVGFGISQVLPIIVQGFLSKDDSFTIIEQPEIHLHPKMQAELADLFIDVINTGSKNQKTLLIETHSESILKRLRRRISENKISNEDVAIYFVHARTNKLTSAKIERLKISKTGAFDWPQEFYSTDFEDTSEFLKYQ